MWFRLLWDGRRGSSAEGGGAKRAMVCAVGFWLLRCKVVSSSIGWGFLFMTLGRKWMARGGRIERGERRGELGYAAAKGAWRCYDTFFFVYVSFCCLPCFCLFLFMACSSFLFVV